MSAHDAGVQKKILDFSAKIVQNLNRMSKRHPDRQIERQKITTFSFVIKTKVTTSKRRTCDICSEKFNKEHTFKTHMETIHAGTMTRST